MEKIRDAVREMLEGRAIVESTLPLAPLFALLLPVLQLLNLFRPIGFYTAGYSVIWILYLVGLMFCFAQGKDQWIGLSCALRALTSFFSMFSTLTLNTMVYLIFYGAFAWYFLRAWTRTPDGAEFLAGVKSRLGIGLSQEDPMAVVTCVRCGAVTSEENFFCPKCGTPLVKKVRPDQPGKCSHCGSRLEPGARFCPKCGRMTDKGSLSLSPDSNAPADTGSPDGADPASDSHTDTNSNPDSRSD